LKIQKESFFSNKSYWAFAAAIEQVPTARNYVCLFSLMRNCLLRLS